MSAPMVYHCWTNNCRGSGDHQLYVEHAWIEAANARNKTLCGCRIQEIGEPVDAGETVGCQRCKKSLEKLNRKKS